MAAIPMPDPNEWKCPRCVGTAAEGRIFPSEASLQGHINRFHKMTKAQRLKIANKRVATMRKMGTLRKLEEQVPDATVIRRGPGRPKVAPALPSGDVPTFEDALAFLEHRRDMLNDIINDLRRLKSGAIK